MTDAAYGLVGTYKFTHQEEGIPYNLMVEFVQSDAYAPPSRFRAWLSTEAAGIPKDIFNTPTKCVSPSNSPRPIALF